MLHRLRYAPFLVFLLFSSCKTNTFLSSVDTERVTVSDETDPSEDPEVLALILPYSEQLDAKMNRVIGQLETDLIKELPEGTLNNWMTDIIHDRASHYSEKSIDFAIQNYGGIRIPKIGAGPLIVRTIYELMPFDNEIVVVELDGRLMKQMFNHIAQGRGWPVSSAVKMTIDNKKRAQKVSINGEPIDMSKTYLMALPDYVANGGGGCTFLKTLPQIKTGWMVRDAIIDYLDNHNTPMSAQIENRIVQLENEPE